MYWEALSAADRQFIDDDLGLHPRRDHAQARNGAGTSLADPGAVLVMPPKALVVPVRRGVFEHGVDTLLQQRQLESLRTFAEFVQRMQWRAGRGAPDGSKPTLRGAGGRPAG